MSTAVMRHLETPKATDDQTTPVDPQPDESEESEYPIRWGRMSHEDREKLRKHLSACRKQQQANEAYWRSKT